MIFQKCITAARFFDQPVHFQLCSNFFVLRNFLILSTGLKNEPREIFITNFLSFGLPEAEKAMKEKSWF